MWTIYSIGDAGFLEQVLTALAMISGTGNLEQLAMIGMMVGLLIMGFQSLLEGTGIKFQNLLVSWIIYAAIFGGSATVLIEDVHSGITKVVDNVPQGVAAGGSIVSTLGYRTTEIFEQAFGTVSYTEQGFAFGLEVLAEIRKASLSPSALGSANSPDPGQKGDFFKSWTNYVSDCTMVGVDKGDYTVEQIQKNTRFPGSATIEQLKYLSENYGTKIYIDEVPRFQNCKKAFGSLELFTQGQFVIQFGKHVSDKLDLPSGTMVNATVSDAFQALQNASVSAQDYMITSALEPIFQWGMANNEQNFQRVASAAMLHTSIQQRNEAWAAEQALFNTMIRPMMTFFEALIFAITPLMAFLIGLGPTGFKLVGKYLMIMMWIQLWMPVMAIVNLYIHMSAGAKMTALQDGMQGDLVLNSFYGHHALDQTVQNYIATGSMLAGSVPGITLMLIYGSAVTATSLTGKMTSGNTPANNATPDLMQNGAVFQNEGMQKFNQVDGSRYAGADSAQDKMTAGQSMSSSIKSLDSEQKAASQNYGHSMGTAMMESAGSTQKAFNAAQNQIGDSASHQQSESAAYDYGMSLLEDSGLSQDQKSSIAASVGATASGSLGAGKGQNTAAAGLSAGITQKFDLSETQSEKLNSAIKDNFGKTESQQAAFNKSMAETQASGDENAFTKAFQLNDNESVTSDAREAYTATQAYEASSQAAKSMDTSRTLSGGQMGQMALNNSGLRQDVDQFYQEYGDKGYNKEASELYDYYTNDLKINEDQAEYASKLMAIGQGEPLDNPEMAGTDAEIDGLNIMGQMFDRNFEQINPGEHEGISGNTQEEAAQRTETAKDIDHDLLSGASNLDELATIATENARGLEPVDVNALEGYEGFKKGALADFSEEKQGMMAAYILDGMSEEQLESAKRRADDLPQQAMEIAGSFGDGFASGDRAHEVGNDIVDENPGRYDDISYSDFANMGEGEQKELMSDLTSDFKEKYQEEGFSERMAGHMAAESAHSFANSDDGLFEYETLGMFDGNKPNAERAVDSAMEDIHQGSNESMARGYGENTDNMMSLADNYLSSSSEEVQQTTRNAAQSVDADRYGSGEGRYGDGDISQQEQEQYHNEDGLAMPAPAQESQPEANGQGGDAQPSPEPVMDSQSSAAGGGQPPSESVGTQDQDNTPNPGESAVDGSQSAPEPQETAFSPREQSNNSGSNNGGGPDPDEIINRQGGNDDSSGDNNDDSNSNLNPLTGRF